MKMLNIISKFLGPLYHHTEWLNLKPPSMYEISCSTFLGGLYKINDMLHFSLLNSVILLFYTSVKIVLISEDFLGPSEQH